MDQGKETYARKRGYSKVHVMTWTIHLEKDGFVPCSFQNCKFMAFNVVEMKNHYNTCKGEGFQAAYECKYCKGRTEHADKLEEHIVRYHGHEAEHSVIETNTNAKSSKEPDEDIFQAINGKSEISKVVIYSWNASKEMYGYIKCRDCCLLSDEVEDMKSHLFTCQKNPSAFPYECQKCNGRVANQTTLDCHMAECHKDAILGDDNFIEKFSNFWKEQIDMRGFAKCGERCKFVHTDCSKIIKHFKASCSMEAGCQAVMYCDTQSCCTWSTSKEALLKHQKTDHILKASDFGETGNIKEVVLEQNSKSRKRNRKLTQRISDGPSSVKCDPINKLQPESKDVSLQKKPIEELQKEIRKFTAKRSVVWHSTLETEGHNTHSMDNSSEREATKSPSEPIPENNQVHCSKEVSEDRPINDDLYQLKSSTVKTEITIEDPLSFESEDHIFFTKQSDYSRLEDGASNKMKKILISDDEDDDSTLEIKPMGLIDKNRKSCSKVADTSPNNLKESDKNDSLSPEQDTKTKLKDSGKLVTNETNRLYGKKYGRKSNLIKENSGTVRSGDVFLTNDLSHGNIEDEKDCHVSKNKRGRPKNIGSKKKEDLTENHMVSPQKQFRSERLRKLSRGLDPDMEEELLTTSIQDRKVLAENESFKVMTSDLNSIETTFPAQDDLQNSCEVQKLKETSKAINLSSMSQDESTTIKKKRGRPRKNRGRSSGSNPSKNSQDEYFSTHLSQEKIGEYEKNDSNLENQIEKAGVSEEVSHLKPKGIEDETVEISCNTNFKEMKLSITQNDTPSIESDHKKISSDMGETLVGVTPTSDNSGKGVVNSEDRLRKLKNHSEEEELQFPEPERIPKEPGVSWAKKNFSDGKGEKIARFIESPHVALKIVEKRETPKESISVSREDSTKVLSNQKKHGRPRKDSPGLISTPGKSETTETEEGKEHIKMSDEAKKQSNWAIKLKSNSSFHDDVLVVSSSAKKYGRSRQDSLNFECQSEKVVTTPPVHEKEKSFRDCIGEAGKDLEKCEPIKPMQVEKHVEESEEMSYETNDQTKELKTPPSVDNSRNKSETSKKKRGRPKKIISYPHEDAPSNQNKGEEPRENDFESVRNSEKNVPGSSTGWEEIESFKDDIGVDENNIKDSEVVKAQKTEETRDDLVAMSSETNNPVIELETTPPSLDNSNNKAETIRKKQGKAKSAPEDSTSVPVSPKKLKNPKEKSLDSERNSGKVVPISPGLQETENFKDDIGEERKIMNESVQIKPQEIGGNRDDNVSISSETKCLAMELEATPSSLVNLQNEADPIKKKRGRSKKIISSSHEDTTNIQASPKKRGGSRESNLNSVRKLEEVLPASPVQEEREHFENVIGGVEENMEDSESTCSKRNEIREETEKLTNVPTYVPTCNDNKSSEMYSNEMKSITSPKEDSSLNVGKDQSQSKTIDDTGTLEKHSEGGDSKLNKQTKIDEQINEDLDVDDSIMPTQEGIGEENVEINDMSSVQDQKPEELGPTLPSPSTIKKKRGRPKKRKLSQEDNVQIGKSKPLGSTLDDSNIEESKILVGNTIDENPNNDSCGKSAINDELSISSTRPEQRIKKKPRSTRETGTVHKKTSKGNNESVLEVQSISEVSGQLNASSVSSIPSISTRKKRGHPKKTSTISGSTNDPEPHQKEEVMSKRKRTSKKPFKLSSYVTDNSDFESTLDDTEEGLSKVAESSTIADNSEDTLKSSSAPQALKRRPGRPKKIINTALDVSVDAENFNKSLETKQGLFSTPRNRQRSVSTPKKYKDYTDELSRISSTSTSNLSKEIQDVNEGSADQKGEKDLSRKRKRRSRLSSDDFFYPEIEAKDRKVPKNPEQEGTKDKTNEENIEMEPVDKVENHLSPEIVKPRKNKPPGRQVKKVTCSVCKQSFSRLQYEVHAADHNYFCWVEGEREYDFEKEDDMHSAFYVFRKFKNFKGLKCEKCGIYKKSSVGFISHRTMCGISDIEKEMLKVPCPVCKRFMLPSSLKVHMGTDHRPNTKVSIDEIEVPGSSKRAAAIRAGTILEETKLQEEDANESEEVKAENLRKWYRYKKRAVTLVREELNPDENNELHCPEQNCSFKSDDLDSLQAHHSQCTKLHMDYECRICTAGFKELHLINEHILANHKEVVENDATDMEFEVDSQKEEYDEEEEQQQPTQESTIFGRPNFLKQEYSRSGLNFIYRNLQRNHDRLHTSHAQGSLLYSDLLAVANGFLNEEDLLSYIPNTLQSMKISLDGNNWEKLKFMEGRATEDASYVFVGGPVWAMDWCPSSTTDDHQWLAVSCHRDMDALHQMGQVFSYNNLIQIWDFGAINLLSSRMEVPSLSIGIAHSEGTAWDVRWCPDGCHQPDTGRLGLLAAAFSSGAALIYSVPLVTTERGKPFYKLNPVIELISPHDEPVQCCRIAWSCESPFNIVAVGYEDGSVSLYDITTSSLLLKEGTKVHPYKVFTAHVDCITGLQFIANRTGRNLMTCSMDRALTFWNLQDTSTPITCNKKVPVRNAIWMDNWLCAVSVYDDCYTTGVTHLNVNNFRDFFYLVPVPWLGVNNTNWSVTASDWSNSIAMSSEIGEVYAVYPSQLFYVDAKAVKRNSMYITSTVLKKLNSEGIEDKKNEKLDTAGPSTYKHAADNFGLVFTESRGAADGDSVGRASLSKNLFPITSINKVSYNPNRHAFTYLAIGHQCGVLRVVRDHHFDFVKDEMFKFGQSLLMR